MGNWLHPHGICILFHLGTGQNGGVYALGTLGLGPLYRSYSSSSTEHYLFFALGLSSFVIFTRSYCFDRLAVVVATAPQKYFPLDFSW